MRIATRSKDSKRTRQQGDLTSRPVEAAASGKADLAGTIRSVVEGLGYQLVDLEAANRAAMVRVFIDRPDADVNDPLAGINVRDCELVTRQLQQVLAVEDIDYGRLEVSSPGLDRVLKTAADFRRFVGFDAEVRLRIPRGVRRRFVGVIRGVSGEDIKTLKVELEVEGAIDVFALEEIDKARLVPKV